MFAFVRERVLGLLRVPGEPASPEGASLLVFRADEGYYRYRIALFFIVRALMLLVFAYAAFIVVLVATAIAAEGRSKKLFDRVDPDTLQTIVLTVGGAFAALYLLHCVVAWATMRLDYELRWYKVTDRSLRIREGVWFVREMTMSFANIQNISIAQGPIQKLFGVSDVMVQSAGGGGGAEQGRSLHVGYFRGIADAPRVRDLMLERLRKHRDAGLGDGDERTVTMEDALREVRDEARALRVAATTAR